MSKMVDYIIVGQGIAGSMVAHFLLKQGAEIIVFDKFNSNSASNIAAGVVNPVTGRKMVKSWMIDELLPFAKTTYKDLERQLNTSFFFEKDIYKIFTSIDDLNIWNQKKNETEYKDYLGDITDKISHNIHTPFGAGIIKQSCWLDVPEFVKQYRNFLIDNDLLYEYQLNTSLLKIADTIQYEHIIADKIIFCEGYMAHQNPLFTFVPFTLAKGEQLLIYAEDLKSDNLLNKNIYIIPKEADYYSVGSTFVWNDVKEQVTVNGRNEIINKLNRVYSGNYTIIEEKAGIRPTMKDRRPVLGTHPEYKNVTIFNGMGTKGVSVSPFFGNYFVNALINNDFHFPEVDVKRFLKEDFF